MYMYIIYNIRIDSICSRQSAPRHPSPRSHAIPQLLDASDAATT